jgi:hypothetical protein
VFSGLLVVFGGLNEVRRISAGGTFLAHLRGTVPLVPSGGAHRLNLLPQIVATALGESCTGRKRADGTYADRSNDVQSTPSNRLPLMPTGPDIDLNRGLSTVFPGGFLNTRSL